VSSMSLGGRLNGRLLRERTARPVWPTGLPRVRRVESAPPPDLPTSVISYALTLASVVLLVLLLNLALVSQIQHFTAQNRLYGELRLSLAEGSVPIGQTDIFGAIVEPGTPIALLEIPAIGVNEVVVEGSSSQETKIGVGHRRDTPLPGQAGVPVLMGRSSAYGGVFARLDQLRPRDRITVTTGQGVSTYEVIGPRLGTVEVPALTGENGRLTLVTAAGSPFQPGSALRVDAELVGTRLGSEEKFGTDVFPMPPTAITSAALPPQEAAMAGDRSRAFSLSWLAQLLVLAAFAAVWAWKRWSPVATGVVFPPILGLLSLACADRITDLLPNLL
jgi:sortase A